MFLGRGLAISDVKGSKNDSFYTSKKSPTLKNVWHKVSLSRSDKVSLSRPDTESDVLNSRSLSSVQSMSSTNPIRSRAGSFEK